jgi:hypothetical protein
MSDRRMGRWTSGPGRQQTLRRRVLGGGVRQRNRVKAEGVADSPAGQTSEPGGGLHEGSARPARGPVSPRVRAHAALLMLAEGRKEVGGGCRRSRGQAPARRRAGAGRRSSPTLSDSRKPRPLASLTDGARLACGLGAALLLRVLGRSAERVM